MVGGMVVCIPLGRQIMAPPNPAQRKGAGTGALPQSPQKTPPSVRGRRILGAVNLIGLLIALKS